MNLGEFRRVQERWVSWMRLIEAGWDFGRLGEAWRDWVWLGEFREVGVLFCVVWQGWCDWVMLDDNRWSLARRSWERFGEAGWGLVRMSEEADFWYATLFNSSRRNMENGRRPQFFWKLRMTSILLKMEDKLKLDPRWSQMENDLKCFENGRWPQYSFESNNLNCFKWRTTFKNQNNSN